MPVPGVQIVNSGAIVTSERPETKQGKKEGACALFFPRYFQFYAPLYMYYRASFLHRGSTDRKECRRRKESGGGLGISRLLRLQSPCKADSIANAPLNLCGGESYRAALLSERLEQATLRI